jgi:hypothetical protein
VPGGVLKPWAWIAAAFVVVLAGEGTGLLQAFGIDPRAAMRGVLLCGLCLVLFEDVFDRVVRRPWF